MTKEEVKQLIYDKRDDKDKIHLLSLFSFIEDIYDDFESRTCENCKHQEGIGCEVYPSAWNWFSLNESEFSCNQWKAK